MINQLQFYHLPIPSIKTVSSMLGQRDTITLSQVSKQLRSKIISEDFWDEFVIKTNERSSRFESRWMANHNHILKLKNLELYVYSQSQERVLELFKLIANKVNNLQVLKLVTPSSDQRVGGEILKFFIMQCHQLKRLKTSALTTEPTLKDTQVQMQYLQITDQGVRITNDHIKSFPLVRHLVIKSYQVNFASITQYLQQVSDILEELELDCEEYTQSLMYKMLKSLNPLVITNLRLFHLENIGNQTLLEVRNYPRLVQLALTKTFSISSSCWLDLFRDTSWPHLENINLTEANNLSDDALMTMIDKSPKLRIVRLAWCSRVSSPSILFLIERCKLIQQLSLVGLKNLQNCGFGEFDSLTEGFDEGEYFRTKRAIQSNRHYKFQYTGILRSGIKLPETLKNLKLLDCQSCDAVGDNLLRVIALFRGRAKVNDYYGNLMGLYDFEEDYPGTTY